MAGDDFDYGPDGYRVIQVPNTLRAKVGPGKGVDPARLRAAAQVIESLSGGFLDRIKDDLTTIEAELAILEAADTNAGTDADTNNANIDAKAAAVRAIFAVVHELRGEAGTFGYNLATRIGNMLCVYIDALAHPQNANSRIVRHHCDALRAIVTGQIKGDGGDIGKALLADLSTLVRRLS